MTNRTILLDQTRLVDGSYGKVRLGTYYRKAQSGGNSPVLKDDMAYTMSMGRYRDQDLIDVTTVRPDGTRSTVKAAGGMMWWGYGGSIVGSTIWSTDDEYALLARLTTKIRDHQFNAAVFGAEARSSLEMVTESAIRIARALKYVKKGDVTRAARALRAKKPGKVHKDAANNWLELQYGWLPLLSDAYNAGQALASTLNRPQRLTFRQKFKRNLAINPTQAGNSGSAFIQKQVIIRVREDYSKVSALGLDDPLTIAWELLPYSFVADWFLPIGDFLDYRSVMGGVKGTFVSTVTTKMRVQGGKGMKLSGGLEIIISGGTGFDHETVEMKRTVGGYYAVPLPSFQNPLDLSWKRTVSAVALLTQRFSRK